MRFLFSNILLSLLLSANAPTHKTKVPVTTYIVKHGDTLVSIARKSAMTVNELLAQNDFGYNHIFKVGEKVQVFCFRGPVKKYIVKEGDSIISVARKTATPIKILTRLNHIDFKKNRIRVGQRLFVKQIKVKRKKKKIDLVIAEAKRYLGVRYKWGGMSFKGIDCSALMVKAFKRVGVKLERVSSDQFRHNGKKVRFKDLQKGDLIYFSAGRRYVGHVGMVIDPKKHLMIQATSSRRYGHRVAITTYTNRMYKRRYRGAKRITRL